MAYLVERKDKNLVSMQIIPEVHVSVLESSTEAKMQEMFVLLQDKGNIN